METFCSIVESLYELLLESGKLRASKPEHGGIFIGSIRGTHLEIDDLTFPFYDDESTMFSFIRKERQHQKQALNAWRKSNFTKTYIGEWHTHPSGLAEPSNIDKATWKRIVLENKRSMVFAISTPIELKFFLGAYMKTEKKEEFSLSIVFVELK